MHNNSIKSGSEKRRSFVAQFFGAVYSWRLMLARVMDMARPAKLDCC